MNPFASIWDDVPTATATAPKPAAKPAKPKADHGEARAIYDRYTAKRDALAPHRAYARAVVAATAGAGMTAVKPLATMGTGGGPLLCDHCGRPMILEGGSYNRVPVDVAWKRNAAPADKWVSYISGGMVVEITTNGTVRIYHGHTNGQSGECATAARDAFNAADDAFNGKASGAVLTKLNAFLRDAFPDQTDRERMDTISAIVLTLFTYDPGTGVNRP